MKKRIAACFRSAMPKAGRLCLWLLRIILPISLAVRLLQYWGVMNVIAGWMTPVFHAIGLSGETAIVFITSCFLPLYAPIAVMTSMSITVREASILALMCLVSHNLPVECAVTHKTGSSFWGMVLLRIGMSFAIAIFLNIVLPENNEPFGMISQPETYGSVSELLLAWGNTSLTLILTILCIVSALMILQSLLDEFKLTEKLSAPLTPLMHFFGMTNRAPFLWIVGNLVGLSYGGAVMSDMVDSGKISKNEANLVNHHLSISHSLLEDTFLFVALGINFWLIVGTRLLFAFITVWGLRGIKRIQQTQ